MSLPTESHACFAELFTFLLFIFLKGVHRPMVSSEMSFPFSVLEDRIISLKDLSVLFT